MARTKPAADAADAPLKRLGGGRWQTRDERFTIEPQSGTWVVVDAEQTDDFGLPLVRGPFASLTAAKDGISAARESEPAASPLAERIDRRTSQAAAADSSSAVGGESRAAAGDGNRSRGNRKRPSAAGEKRRDVRDGGDSERATGPAARPKRPAEPDEPAWLTDLEPGERGRARRLIARLLEAGHEDAVSIVRRDVLGDVPAVAAVALTSRLAELGDDAAPDAVVELLADGRDDRLDVRWRLVDGEGRPIVIERTRRSSRR
jgi:hypothetical protein